MFQVTKSKWCATFKSYWLVYELIWTLKTDLNFDFVVSNGYMMTSSNGNIFRVAGHLCGKFIGQQWIPRTKASDVELWCFLWSAPE